MPQGNPAKLQAWRDKLTPEQKEEWKRKIKEGMKTHKTPRVARVEMNGLAIRVMSIKNGRYVVGTCRTINITDVKWDPDDIRNLLVTYLKKLKDNNFKQRSKFGVIEL